MNRTLPNGKSSFFERHFASRYQEMEQSLTEALAFLDEVAFPIPEFTLELILRESLVNAVKHGNKLDENKQVLLHLSVSETDGLTITIKDEGDGFDWRKKGSQGMPGVEQDQGRGLALMRAYDYTPQWNEKGNKLTLYIQGKRIHCPD